MRAPADARGWAVSLQRVCAFSRPVVVCVACEPGSLWSPALPWLCEMKKSHLCAPLIDRTALHDAN